MFNSRTGQRTVLPECPKQLFSIKGELTAIGGRQADNAVKTLISLPRKGSGIFQQKWIEQFPPMAFYHNFPTVTTTNTRLIVAGGFGPDRRKAAVEVMDIETLQWSTVASLPHPFSESTGHHLWRETLYRRWVHHLCKRYRVSGNV